MGDIYFCLLVCEVDDLICNWMELVINKEDRGSFN